MLVQAERAQDGGDGSESKDLLEAALAAGEAYDDFENEEGMHAEAAHAVLVCAAQGVPVAAALRQFGTRLDMEGWTSVLVCLSRVGQPQAAADVVAWMETEGRCPPTGKCLVTIALRRLAMEPEPPFVCLLEPFQWMRRNSVNPSGAAVDALAQVTKRASRDYAELYALEEVCHWMKRTDAGKTLWGAYFNMENMLAVEDRGMTREEVESFRDLEEVEQWKRADHLNRELGRAAVDDSIDAILQGREPRPKPQAPNIAFAPPPGPPSQPKPTPRGAGAQAA